MKKTIILYIGKHPEILETVLRLINANEEWNGIGTTDEEDAKYIFKKYDVSLVLLGPGIDADTEKELCDSFKNSKQGIKIVQHYGGGSGLLRSEIIMALL